MKILIPIGSGILSISTFAFLIHPTIGHFASNGVLFACLIMMSIMHTIDEHKKLVSIFTPHKFQVYEPSEIAKQFHALPKGAYVYVIQDIDVTGYCKIGKTNSVYQRMHNIGVKMPFRTQIIHVIHCQNMSKVEAALHRLFADNRIEGEWFNLDIVAIEYLKTKDNL